MARDTFPRNSRPLIAGSQSIKGCKGGQTESTIAKRRLSQSSPPSLPSTPKSYKMVKQVLIVPSEVHTLTPSQQRAELHRQIWAIANNVRGAVDGRDFKHYVLGALFYRFMNENFASYIEAGDESIPYAECTHRSGRDLQRHRKRCGRLRLRGGYQRTVCRLRYMEQSPRQHRQKQEHPPRGRAQGRCEP